MDEAELPNRIGSYEIVRKVGAGGMGTVYLGRHVESGLEAAVKVLPATLAREAGTVDRFNREIDAMRQLSGPHIVTLYENGHDEETDQMYFAMEYVEGRTLTECILSERRLSWDQSVDIALQICSALKVAHSAGVVHRDIKPSNLLIGANGVVKLTDFGVAQIFATRRLTATGGVIGTAEYMSPEQAQGRRCTRASDLYSLGAVLYAMLTGRPPFTGKNSVEIIQKHATARFDRPSLYVPELPRMLEDVVCKLLEKNPEDRYTDAHVVSLRLKEVVKRVELATNDETIARPNASSGLLSPTATAPGHSTHTGPDDVTFASGLLDSHEPATQHPREENRHVSPGSATMMRDAFRAEYLKEQEKSPLAALFDNTWFLVICLILLVAGGFLWMDGVDRSSAPIEDSEHTADGDDAQGEITRFMRLAKSYRRNGDAPREQRVLEALKTVIAYDETNGSIIDEIDQRLEFLNQQRERRSGEGALARRTVDRASDLIDAGKHEEALSLLDSLLVLYDGDEAAQAQLSRAAELRIQINSGKSDPVLESAD